MFAKIVTIAATGIAAVHACTGATPFAANPIYFPTTTDYPTMGQPYIVQWDNTNQGPTVTLSLYQGCPDNCVEVTDIVGGVANTGTYTWNVQCTADWPYLKPDVTALGYEILLIDEKGCKTQKSTNFGIHPDAIGCCGDNPPAGCNQAAVVSSAAASSAASSAVSSPTSTTTATTATSKASSATSTTVTTKKSSTTTATSATTTAKSSTTTAAVQALTTIKTSSAVTASASAKSGAAAATAPARALGGVVVMLAAGLVL